MVRSKFFTLFVLSISRALLNNINHMIHIDILSDEITSGLDSENAVLVIDVIKNLCKKLNAAAVVVIHQPSYEVFNHFDRLVLLSKGKCIYANEVVKISSFYDEIGRTEPDEKYLVPNDILQAAAKWDKNEYKLK